MEQAKLRYINRRVIEPGCRFCRDLLAYTAVDAAGTPLGEVRMVRLVDGHPDDWHYGVDWQGVLPGGTLVTGCRSPQGFDHGDGRFASRARAGAHLLRAHRS